MHEFHTNLCSILEIELPIMQAGMGSQPGLGTAAGPKLAAAVSEAGGLGVLGCVGMTPKEISEWIRETRRLTNKPFGVDLVLPPSTGVIPTVDAAMQRVPETHVRFVEDLKAKAGIPDAASPTEPHWSKVGMEYAKQQVEVVLDERVPVFVSGLGDPGFMVEEAHAHGIKVMGLVGNTKNARRLRDSGVDVVIATGSEGGGHSSRVGTMALVPQVVDAVAPTLVAAGGGIVDGRGLVAALALGAVGVWCGTLFLASEEAAIPQWWKDLVVQASDESTVQSKFFTGKQNRHFRSPWDEAWEESGLKPLPMPLQGMLSWPVMDGAAQAGMHEWLGARAGQGSGAVTGVRPAASIVHDLIREASEVKERLDELC